MTNKCDGKEVVAIDPADDLPVEPVGPWSITDKHELLRRYVRLTHGARKNYLGPDKAGSCLIDLYCSFGRVLDRESGAISDGGALCAWKESQEKSAPFSRVILGDINPACVDACSTRLTRAGASVISLAGPAAATVTQALSNLDPYGLHLAYLDPYNLESLPFSVIEKLAKLRRVDFIVHFSTIDLQRNFDRLSAQANGPLDQLVPGWRRDHKAGAKSFQRHKIFDYWRSLTEDLGFTAGRVRHVKGPGNQNLYYLVYLSRHPLGNKLWDATERECPQRSLL